MTQYIVSKDEATDVLNGLSIMKYLSIDTETYGLGVNDKPFALIISDVGTDYYFNFSVNRDIPLKYRLTYHNSNFNKALNNLFLDEDKTWFGHNIQFDYSKVYSIGFLMLGELHCTMIAERLLDNTLPSYSLDAVAKRYGFEKDSRVEEYIKTHGLYEEVISKYTNKKEKIPKYYDVPFDLITKYGMKDSRIAFDIGIKQMEKLKVL